jgi:tetratricopeptide (TPR) repeat protein
MTSIIKRVAVLVAVLWTHSASADDVQEAQALYDEGMAHYRLQEYDAAIDRWQAGFRLKHAPELLYNIGQAYRLSKRPEQALLYYRNYLSMAPDPPNRDEVERHIAELQKTRDEQQPKPSPSRVPPARVHDADARSNALVAAPPPRPRRKTGLVVGIVLGSFAAAGLAVGLGVGLSPHAPSPSYGAVTF